MKVLVITGGDEDEREISFISASNVAIALLRLGHSVEMFNLTSHDSQLNNKVKEADVVFPVLHGKEGEGGALQEFLEKNQAKFVGSGSKACYQGWNKLRFKEFCKKNSITTPPWTIFSNEAVGSFPKPYVIKPADSGSSRGIYIIKEESELQKISQKELKQKYDSIFIEKYIDGVEVTVGVLGQVALPVVEIRPPEGEWFDYENKYSGRTKELAPAPSMTLMQKEELKEISLRIFNGLNCRHYARIDFIVSGKDIFVLEINTIPGLTPESLLPKAAKAAGITFDEMISQLVKMATKTS